MRLRPRWGVSATVMACASVHHGLHGAGRAGCHGAADSGRSCHDSTGGSGRLHRAGRAGRHGAAGSGRLAPG